MSKYSFKELDEAVANWSKRDFPVILEILTEIDDVLSPMNPADAIESMYLVVGFPGFKSVEIKVMKKKNIL